MNSAYGAKSELNLKLLVVLGRMIKSLDAVLIPDIGSAGLTPSQFGVLEALYHKGPMTVNGVIQKTLSTSGNMGVVIDNLISAGFVQKEVVQADKRSRILSLTERGTQLIEDYFPRHVETLNRCMSGISGNEKEQLIQLMKKLGKSIR